MGIEIFDVFVLLERQNLGIEGLEVLEVIGVQRQFVTAETVDKMVNRGWQNAACGNRSFGWWMWPTHRGMRSA